MNHIKAALPTDTQNKSWCLVSCSITAQIHVTVTLDDGVEPEPEPRSFTADLGAWSTNDDEWNGSIALPAWLSADGTVKYFRHLDLVGASVQIEISETADGTISTQGDLNEDWEVYAEAITLDGDGDEIILKGPGSADNTFVDATEPYFWTPDNSADVNTFLSTINYTSLTVTFRDGSFPSIQHELTPEFSGTIAGALSINPVRVQPLQHELTPEFSGTIAGALDVNPTRTEILRPEFAGTLTGMLTIEPAAALLLRLADLDIPAGRDIVLSALIETRADDLYGPDATDGFILDGDDPLDLSGRNINISFIRVTTQTRFRINHDGTGDFEALFEAGGALDNVQVTVQTGADESFVLESSAINAGRSTAGRVEYDLTASQMATVQGLADGDRWIFAFHIPTPNVYEITPTFGGALTGAFDVSRALLNLPTL